MDNQIVSSIKDVLEKLDLKVKLAETIFQRENTPFSGEPKERAAELMKMFVDEEVKMIFDISGGDSANQVLPYLDYDAISKNPKSFVGISDLSVILNAIYARSHVATLHYQIANLTGRYFSEQRKLFHELFMNDQQADRNFLTFNYSWLRGHGMKGTIVGGNIRCFLKLAGTSYMPDPTNKILFLESLGGGASRMASLISQLQQIGYLQQCNGILLGTFSEMTAQSYRPTIEELVLKITDEFRIPVAITNKLGHGADAHCLPIGLDLSFT